MDLSTPDLTISMYPDRCAPRAARYCVGTIERPPAEIRESLVLLTSELVSRAVRLHDAGSHELFELRVWIDDLGARVELRGARELVCATPQLSEREDDLLLVDAFADRWDIDANADSACIWFEIDSHANEDAPRPSRLRSALLKRRAARPRRAIPNPAS